MERKLNRIWPGIAIAALALSLAACAGDGTGAASSQNSSAPESTEDTPVQQEPAQDYAIDECLVGVWTTVSQREQTTVNGEALVLIDVERQLSFAADGVEVVTYLDTPAAVQSTTGETLGEVVTSGELTFQVSTDQPGTISFELTGGEVTATFDIRGQSATFTAGGDFGPVSYTCSAGELTQSANGYEAVFTRAV